MEEFKDDFMDPDNLKRLTFYKLRRTGIPHQNWACLCAISKLSTLLWKIILGLSCGKLSEKLKNGIKILVGLVVLRTIVQNMENIILIRNLGTAWPTKLLMSFLTFSDSCFKIHISFFYKIIDNFEIVHKTCSILVWGVLHP